MYTKILPCVECLTSKYTSLLQETKTVRIQSCAKQCRVYATNRDVELGHYVRSAPGTANLISKCHSSVSDAGFRACAKCEAQGQWSMHILFPLCIDSIYLVMACGQVSSYILVHSCTETPVLCTCPVTASIECEHTCIYYSDIWYLWYNHSNHSRK